MASSIIIKDLNGKSFPVIKGAEQTWSQVVQRSRLPERYAYCLRHWMGRGGVESDKERFVKEYLDRIGYILIQDAPDDGILTDYKNMRNRVAEIPTSACAEAENMLYGMTRPADENGVSSEGDCSADGMGGLYSKKAQGVFEALNRGSKKVPKEIAMRQEKRKRMGDIRRAHPNAEVILCRVDADNEFACGDRRYVIDKSVAQYQPMVLKDGDVYYDMDTIIVVSGTDGIFFYDQEGREIERGLVRQA